MTGARLLVAPIPTNGTAFAEYVARVSGRLLRDGALDLVGQEAHAKARLVEFLDHAGIAHVATPALGRKVADRLYTRSDGECTRTEMVTESLGEVVAEFLGEHQPVELARP